ncbi:MAG: InlB B-repeat-containing protein [Lachnospiraceae bacterium]|nr:InlB B-repeat-containing protein [Lachnospiraceae bacterium]
MNFRKRLAVLLSAVMVLTAAMPVYAAENVETAVNSEVFETADTAEVTGSAEGTGSVEETGSIEEIGSLEEIEAVEAVEEIISAEETAEKEALKDGALLGDGINYFYVQAEWDELEFALKYAGGVSGMELEFSYDGSGWFEYYIGYSIGLPKKGDRVYFKASTYNDRISVSHGAFQTEVNDKPFSVGGDITTLITREGNADIPDNFFEGMFAGNKYLISAENLVIPDVKLGKSCCAGMFNSCTYLETAPAKLQSKSLGIGCYSSMFGNCTYLKKAPDILPAETLAKGCYIEMFNNCPRLEKAPELPAQTLVDDCYFYMFKDCSSLKEVKVGFSSWGIQYTQEWLMNVSAEGTFYGPGTLPDQRGATNCHYIPEGWRFPHKITVTDDGNGTASADPASASKDETVTLTAVPAAGYRLLKWESDDVTVADDGTFTMPSKDVAVKAVFGKTEYAVNVSSGGNGTANADPSTAVLETEVTLTAVPDEGYRFDHWESSDVIPVNNKFAMPAKNVSVKAVFKEESYTVNAITAGGGTVSADHESAAMGTTVTLTASPDEGYTFAGWKSAEVTVADDGTFTMPSKNVTAIAVFEKIVYTVNVTTNGGGSVNVITGDTVVLEPMPLAGYRFDHWESEDVTVVDNKFEMPLNDVTVKAYFEKILYTVKFDSMGGSEVAAQTVASGDKAVKPTSPNRSGYSFAGWYADTVCTKAFDFNTGISADTTVYAKWSKNSSSGGGSSSGGSGTGVVKLSTLFTGTWGNPVTDGHWSQDDTGAWRYTTTQLFCNTWAYIRNPYAHSGQHEADWFRFDANGIMLTGWQLIDGKWYYLNPTKDGTLGACLIGPGVTPDGYEIDATGARTGR